MVSIYKCKRNKFFYSEKLVKVLAADTLYTSVRHQQHEAVQHLGLLLQVASYMTLNAGR